MKMTGIKKLTNKMAFPLILAVALFTGAGAMADVYTNMICSIKSDQAGKTLTASGSGSYVDVRIKLNGTFDLYETIASPTLQPELRMDVGGYEGWATLYSISPYVVTVGDPQPRTEVVFRYTVKPGDMAGPLTIYGSAGSSTPGIGFQFHWNGWKLALQDDNDTVAVWVFDTESRIDEEADVYDLDLSGQKITIRTLNFDDNNCAGSVAATESDSWRVSSVNAVEDTVVDFVVWTGDPSIVQVGQNSENYITKSMPEGTTEIDFPIHGNAVGSTYIYLQRVEQFSQNTGSVGDPSYVANATNYIRRAIEVTDPPDPTVRIVMANGSDNITLDEAATDSSTFHVELSEAYTNDVYVRIDASILGAPQSNVTFASDPYVVLVAKGDTVSSDAKLYTPDGTLLSSAGVTLTPSITNAVAAAYYIRKRTATVYVDNVAPVVSKPLDGAVFTATRGVNSSFDFTVQDVPADWATMKTHWSFAGSLAVYTGNVGVAYHTFTTTGSKTVTVQAEDKDGALSAEISFTVNVVPPAPRPSVTITPLPSDSYSETSTNSSVMVSLSETFYEDVYIRLETDPADQTNINILTNVFKISQSSTNRSFKFSILDGTSDSGSLGVILRPVITNANAMAYFTDLKETTIYIDNVDPVVIRPLASDLGQPADSTYGYDRIQMTKPFTFDYDIEDVDADLAGMEVTWTFGDGYSTTVIGGAGSVTHTYNTMGDHVVSVRAKDKDGAQSDLIEFKVTVIMPTWPTVIVSAPDYELQETDDYNGSLTVTLTQAFTNQVTVNLQQTLGGSPIANGDYLTLDPAQVVFAVGETTQTVLLIPHDGTSATRGGIRVTPVVASTPAAITFYQTSSDTVRIGNFAPDIISPAQPADDTTITAQLAQDVARRFTWRVNDVDADSDSTMKVQWSWDDDTTNIVYGSSGSIYHTYSTLGEKTITVEVWDKDNGYDTVSFKIVVLQSKTVYGIPAGPNTSAFPGANGLGSGIITSPGARTPVENEANVYTFIYDPDVTSATLEAKPYKAGQNVVVYDEDGNATTLSNPLKFDSFFYVWVAGTDQGVPEVSLDPWYAISKTQVSLPDVGTGTTSDTSVDIRLVTAVFSREYAEADNMGDINADGIPDKRAQFYGLDKMDLVASQADDLEDRMDYNEDQDFLPPSTGYTGAAFVGGLTNVFAAIGREFTAYKEIRGEHEALNYFDPTTEQYISTVTAPLDEPGAVYNQTRGGTDPTKPDTDGDGFPDGWEYYFWRAAKFDNYTGVKYDPNNVAVGETILAKEIEGAFNPIVPTTVNDYGVAADRDMDNDGLLDVEELVIGTNPTNWDTDGDLMCDGWEVLRGLNPNDPDDAGANPDGDFMAYESVPRQWIIAVNNNNGSTNIYLGVNSALGHTSTNLDATYYAYYRYGNASGPIAQGAPVDFPAGYTVTNATDISALIMHYQVRDEFGFDPRTAWIDSISTTRFGGTGVEGGAPHTKAFTTLDEYLLMKFMVANGYAGSIASSAQAWRPVSTDPLTPDTDASGAGTDAVPDGWELYVATDELAEFTGRTGMLISPWDYEDYDDDLDAYGGGFGDRLNVQREFAGVDSSAHYNSAALYASATGYTTVSIVPSTADQYWVNKFWPTNPWNVDTDDDGVGDATEMNFIYNNPTDTGSYLIAGGGMNPNSVDTDLDALPDCWEMERYGVPINGTITNGMDATVSDYDEDWDLDGLLNYQEYWVQAVRSFRYDISTNEIPMDLTFDVSEFFTQLTNDWEVARYPWGTDQPSSWVMYPVVPAFWRTYQHSTNAVIQVALSMYATTDPRNEDTDNDAMDDYYEMYHGLNPILGMGPDGDVLYIVYGRSTMAYYNNPFFMATPETLPMDIKQYPWLAGLPEADCDSDGLINFEEMLLANTAGAMNYNTDPSALWMTDYMNPNSLSSRFYYNGTMFFWPGTLANRLTMMQNYISMFDFEINEGYDTDNDGLSDKTELINSRNPLTDPRNHDDPIRRQAIYFSGTNSAARTIDRLMHDKWTFRSFTVELWANPDRVDRTQVILERSIPFVPSDLNDPAAFRARRTFQIGIYEDGRVYALFDSSGSASHDPHTAEAVVFGPILDVGEWVHVTARMDGNSGQLDIIINGELYEAIDTLLIPATGVVTIDDSPDGTQSDTYIYPGAIVVGAADNTPDLPVFAANPLAAHTWGGFDRFFNGYVDEVRIWDGVRDLPSLSADLYKRYTRSDIEENRSEVAMEAAAGKTRILGDAQLPAELLYHYTFDNIFGAETNTFVAHEPRGFMDPAATTNRPLAVLNTALLFGYSPVTSTVYTNYEYLSLIENGVEHLPIFAGVTNVGDISQAVLSDTVADSIFWSERKAGDVAGTFVFPNDNNPYGISYNFDQDDPVNNSGFRYFGDMLPLGDAYSKTIPVMWDTLGPSSPWTETGTDDDSDGLPEWWEVANTNLFTGSDLAWDDLYVYTNSLGQAITNGMTNGERYLRDLAKGASQSSPTGNVVFVQIADTDGDGMPDWWEDIFSLDKGSASGINGASGDYDRDGLPNLSEYLIYEKYGFRYLSPRLFKTGYKQEFSDYFLKEGSMTYGAMFTDHDFMEDLWEDIYDPYYVNSFVYDAHEDNDEDGWSNWSEARYSAVSQTISPEKTTTLLATGGYQQEYPIPAILTKLSYSGSQQAQGIVINAYSSPEMDGTPDAVFQYGVSDAGVVIPETYNMGFWRDREFHIFLSPGNITPGTIQLQFTDVYSVGTVNAQVCGFDFDGVLYGNYPVPLAADEPSGFEIGTIDYATGEVTIDLGLFDPERGIYYGGMSAADNFVNYALPPPYYLRDQTMIIGNSTVELSYNVQIVNQYPMNLTLRKPDTGYVREGLNYFFAFLDIDGSGTWSAGEPCGLPDVFATDIGWDANSINIQLTDYTEGYLRFDLNSNLRSKDVIMGVATPAGGGSGTSVPMEQRVRVDRKIGYSQETILDRIVTADRTFIHEGDIFAQGDLALDWNLTSAGTPLSVVYNVYIGDKINLTDNVLVCTFTNLYVSDTFAPAQDPAVSTKPINGGYVYSSRPVFRWTMPDLYPAFALEIRKGSPAGVLVYQSGPQKAPSRDAATGECVWEAPIHAGNKLPNGQIFAINTVYAWRVTTLNAKYAMNIEDGSVGTGATTAGWSDWKLFRLDVNRPMESSGYGAIDVNVKYFGPATTRLSGRVKVETYNTRDFTGLARSKYTLTDAELTSLTDSSTTNINAVMRGLTPSGFAGSYFVMAYIDSNDNNKRDFWESWGYANYYGQNVPIGDNILKMDSVFSDLFGGSISAYVAKPVDVDLSANIPKVTIFIEDADTDQDWFPDAWEYDQNESVASPEDDFLALIGAAVSGGNPFGDTEINPDLDEVMAGSSSLSGTLSLLVYGSTDSDGDGVDDYTELLLGTNPTIADSSSVTELINLGVAPDSEFGFKVEGVQLQDGVAELTWNVRVDNSGSTLSQNMLNLLSENSDGTVTYCVDWTPSLSNPDWKTVRSGNVTLDGSKTLVDRISVDLSTSGSGFYRVRLQ